MRAPEALRTLTIVWAALVGGVVLYTGVLFVLTSGGVVELAVISPELMNLVGGLVLLYLMGAVLFRRRLVAGIPALAAADARLARYRTVTIVSLAVMESGGLIVITLAMLAGAPRWILAGGGAAAVIMFVVRPSATELEG